MSKAISIFFILFFSFTLSSSGNAAVVLKIDGLGLKGATGLDIYGSLYDVEFVEGKFSQIFESEIPIVHRSSSRASTFANSLLNEVFVDNNLGSFDSLSSLTYGCNTTLCNVLIPWYTDENIIKNLVASNTDSNSSFFDSIFSITNDFNFNSAIDSRYVYARFTPSIVMSVPEPSTYTMFLFGLLLLTYKIRNKHLG